MTDVLRPRSLVVPARQQRSSPAGDTGYEFEAITGDAQLERLLPDWLELFERSGVQNPFVHPAWVIAWLQHFVPDERERLVIAVRRQGRLVAMAPFYRRRYGLGPTRGRCLQLVGGSPGRDDPLTEMSEVLVLRDGWRKVMRALFHHVAREHGDSFDWIGVTVSAGQGWFDDQWLPDEWQRGGGLAVHKATRPFVVLRLPETWEELPLKRNLREAIRRGRNRLAAHEESTEVEFVEGPETVVAAREIYELHRRRALLRGHAVHDDYFSDEATVRFADRAVEGMARTRNAFTALLRAQGRPLAGRVILRAHGGLFLSVSGADPDYWELGASTLLLVAVIRRAIEAGDTLVNLSHSADQAKLRWSETIEYQNEFNVVAPSRRSRRAFSMFWQIRTRRNLARDREVVRRRYSAD